jgi:hypothetical protein
MPPGLVERRARHRMRTDAITGIPTTLIRVRSNAGLASAVVIMAERPTNTADLVREQVRRVVNVLTRFTSSC